MSPFYGNTRESLGNGEYLVEGMKFQMGGWWVMDFDITVGSQTEIVFDGGSLVYDANGDGVFGNDPAFVDAAVPGALPV